MELKNHPTYEEPQQINLYPNGSYSIVSNVPVIVGSYFYPHFDNYGFKRYKPVTEILEDARPSKGDFTGYKVPMSYLVKGGASVIHPTDERATAFYNDPENRSKYQVTQTLKA